MKHITSALVVAAAIALVPTAALAAPNGKGPSTGSSFTVADGTYGGTTVASVANPPAGTWVEATCYQNAAPVIYNRLPVDASGHATPQLGPTTGYQAGIGGAECSAEAKSWNLKRQRWVNVAVTTFHVSD